MRRFALCLATALILAIPAARAQDAEPPRVPDAAPGPLDRRAWAAEVRQLRAAEREALRTLVREAREAREAAPGEPRARAQAAIEAAKAEWRRRLLEAQLVRARAAGLAEQALQLEQRIAHLDAVAERRLPVAPAGGAR